MSLLIYCFLMGVSLESTKGGRREDKLGSSSLHCFAGMIGSKCSKNQLFLSSTHTRPVRAPGAARRLFITAMPNLAFPVGGDSRSSPQTNKQQIIPGDSLVELIP